MGTLRFVLSSFVLPLVLLLGLPGPSQAAIITFTAELSGLEETPPNASPASGTATLLFDDVLNTFDLDLTVADLLAPIVAYHIHAAPPAVAGPVIVSLSGLNPGLLGLTAGSIHLEDVPFPLANVPDLLAGNTYVNVHTQLFPGGEIRGQLVEQQVPGPATLLLLAGGLAMMAEVGRRRSRRG